MSQEFGWYVAEGGKPVGPLSLDDLLLSALPFEGAVSGVVTQS